MDFRTERARLVALLSGEIKDRKVLAALARIPREAFVPPELRCRAYYDRALPIGRGQTISQPLIVAMMTQALTLTGQEKVLEIGTGSGYQTALLAELATRVVTVERVAELAERSRQLLRRLGYANIDFHPAAETLGWPDSAPYDAIIVTAAAPRVPDELLAQLAPGGRIVIPVGTRYLQELHKITKHTDHYDTEYLGACRFVALIGKSAWEEQEV